MANFVDVPRLINSLLSEVIEVPVRRQVRSDQTQDVPWVNFQVTSPTKVSNAAYRRGVTFTLALNVIHESYREAIALADEVLAATLSLSRVGSPYGRISHIEVVTGPEDANSSISSTNHSQLAMVLTGIARKE